MHYTCIRTIGGIYALLVLMATVSYNKNFSCNQKQNEDKITTLLCFKKVSISLKQLRRKKNLQIRLTDSSSSSLTDVQAGFHFLSSYKCIKHDSNSNCYVGILLKKLFKKPNFTFIRDIKDKYALYTSDS